jgi:hypothetical protein
VVSEGGDAAELRARLAELGVRESSVDAEPQEEEDESELTADELVARVAKFRAERAAVMAELAETGRAHRRSEQVLEDQEWRITTIRGILSEVGVQKK